MRRLSRSTLASLAGLLIGIAGLIIQWIADPAKFAGDPFPPGIAFIAAAGLLMVVTARWWWHPVFGVLIAVWIVGVGTLAGQMQPQLVSDNPGTVAGASVMAGGLILTAVAGVRGMITARRPKPDDRHQTHPI
jgi:hypothetical protein